MVHHEEVYRKHLIVGYDQMRNIMVPVYQHLGSRSHTGIPLEDEYNKSVDSEKPSCDSLEINIKN